MHPSKGEIVHLQMLLSDNILNRSAGKTLFEDMRTVDSVLHDSYKETCRALGLLKDGELWHLVMEDAIH